MMVALQRGNTSGKFSLLNRNSVRDYTYTRESEVQLATPLGNLQTVVYRSERSGSARVNRYWCAPSLGYLPVKVEQKNNGDVQWTMNIESLKK
jgi:hypothetical protein